MWAFFHFLFLTVLVGVGVVRGVGEVAGEGVVLSDGEGEGDLGGGGGEGDLGGGGGGGVGGGGAGVRGALGVREEGVVGLVRGMYRGGGCENVVG